MLKTNLFLFYREDTVVDVVDKDGCTPLLVAAREGCTEAFAKLLERADLEKREKKGRNAVLFAAEADHSEILEVSCTYNIPLMWCDINITAGCRRKISRLLETTYEWLHLYSTACSCYQRQ